MASRRRHPAADPASSRGSLHTRRAALDPELPPPGPPPQAAAKARAPFCHQKLLLHSAGLAARCTAEGLNDHCGKAAHAFLKLLKLAHRFISKRMRPK